MEMGDFNYVCSSFFLVLLPFSIFFFFYIIKKKRCSSSSKEASTFNFYELVKNGHRFLDWSTERLMASEMHTVALPGIVLTASPSNVEHVLKTNFRNYPKGPRSIAILEDLLGRGIFNSDGEHWRAQRKLASLGFNSTRAVRTFVLDAVRSEVVDRLLPFLSAAAYVESAVVDLQDVLERFAFDNVCKITFDFDPGRLSREGNGEGDAFACSYEAATGIIMGRFKKPRLLWSLPRLLGLGRERMLKRELAVLKDIAANIVNEKKKKKKREVIGTGGLDLLSLVMAEGDFSDEFLRDVVLNYVLAGRDTTSSAMSWFFWLVSSRSEVEQRIVGETESVRARHGSSAGSMFTLEELREMNYLHAALSEAMRLYPPVALETRVCAEEDVLPDGTEVAKGVVVMHSPYAMGRMESIWGEDCGEFRPERWLDDSDGVLLFQPRNPYEYPVFHAGPRMCLGKDMAYMQMKAVAASVMERFVVEVVEEEEEGEREQDLVVVLRMKKGLPVRIRAR